MFSYRHAFHAGNHADVLKHLVLIATARHLMQKSGALTLIDTHAGAGIYRLDDQAAQTSGERWRPTSRQMWLQPAWIKRKRLLIQKRTSCRTTCA